MAIRGLVWACILCKQEGALEPVKEGEQCTSCGALYQRGKGAKIRVERAGSRTEYTPRQIVDLLPDPGTSGSARVEVREWAADKPIYALGRYLGRIDQYGGKRQASLRLDGETLSLDYDDSPDVVEIALLDITAVQPGSHAIEINTRSGLYSIRFLDSSSMLWEERLHAALRMSYERAGRGAIAEFLPRICGARESGGPESGVRGSARGASGARIRRRLENSWTRTPTPSLLYRLCSWTAHTLWARFGGSVDITGLEHIPASGPFIVLANHQSYIEPMLIPATVPRPIAPMAKTTQFTVPFFGWLMAQVLAFPVRRFEVDPQAVRFAVRRLSEGTGLMIFPEGERSWDGELQPLRLGVLRFILAARVPVIPCRVTGAYQAWPRWASSPQRHRITLAFGPALDLPVVSTRAEREAVLASVAETIRSAIEPR